MLYSYEKIRNAAIQSPDNKDAVDALSQWFEVYGNRYWNGEYFDCDDGWALYRNSIPQDEDGEEYVYEYELRYIG